MILQENILSTRQFCVLVAFCYHTRYMTLISILPTLQIILSVLLVVVILLQRSEESLGGAFGGSDSVDTVKNTRRGSEKTLFQAAIVIAVLFTLVSIIIVVTK